MFWLITAAWLYITTDTAAERRSIIKDFLKGVIWGTLIFIGITMILVVVFPKDQSPYNQMVVCTGADGGQHVRFSAVPVSNEWHPEIPCNTYKYLSDTKHL